MPFQFPKGFYFGAATSAHQVEGENNNDWTEFEHTNSARLATEAARRHANALARIPDFILKNYPNPLQEENYISEKACDHYSRFKEDFDLAKAIGLNAYRFSIEWSRIEPEEGKFNQKEIEHYREVIKALRERGIEPFVTLWHWTLPIWVAKQGGWESKKTIFYFSRFCEKVAVEFRKEVKFFITLSEPGLWSAESYFYGIKPPQKKNIFSLIQVYFHLLRAHKVVYKKLKAINPDFQIGVAESVEWCGLSLLRPLFDYFRNFFFLHRSRSHLDFIGINYYKGVGISKNKKNISDRRWAIYPEGLYYILQRIKTKFSKPIFITENGLADVQDAKRADFIRDHLYYVSQAIQEGVDVHGYFHWSLLDNFEWEEGFWPRFGFVEVDYRTQQRKIRESAKIYASIIKDAKL